MEEEIIIPPFINEITEEVKQTVQITTKYALFDTIETYNEANNKISVAFGLPDSREATERYASIEPQQDVDGKFVMEISVAVQMFHQGAIEGIELFDNVTYKQEENDIHNL
mgnify:CR=1 FL=1